MQPVVTAVNSLGAVSISLRLDLWATGGWYQTLIRPAKLALLAFCLEERQSPRHQAGGSDGSVWARD